MVINLYENFNIKSSQSPSKPLWSKSLNQSSQRLLKTNYAAQNISSKSIKYDSIQKKSDTLRYFAGDKMENLSGIKGVLHEKNDFDSSYPVAVKIYKANSDEFKTSKKGKKMKKSVLTLPNEPICLPQSCTVSDMNDFKCFDEVIKTKSKTKKRRTIQTNRKPRINKTMKVFDRDAEYCSRLNIDLDSSSTDMINRYTGDGNKISLKRQKYKIPKKETTKMSHDIWTMFRNMNRFSFIPSPPLSEGSIISITKRNATYNKHRNKLDAKIIETHTTAEFSSFSKLEDKSARNSQTSYDRITVIDKQDENQERYKKKNLIKNQIHHNIRNSKNEKNKKSNASSAKAMCYGGDNLESFPHSSLKQKLSNGMLKNSQNTVLCQEKKPLLTYNTYNNNCTNHSQNSIPKRLRKELTAGQIEICENSCSSNGDVKNHTGVSNQITLNRLSPCYSQCHINGITKVVLSKGQDVILPKKADTSQRKLRSVTTMPKVALYPKLTQAEIKRRLGRIQFPLVILGKDQLSSTPFPVTIYEPPHLNILKDRVWPFMQNWQNKDYEAVTKCNEENCYYEEANPHVNSDCLEDNYNKINKGKNPSKVLQIRDEHAVQSVSHFKTQNKHIKSSKINTMSKFKETMTKFTLKKSSFLNDNKKYSRQEPITGTCGYNNVVEVQEETFNSFTDQHKNNEIVLFKKEKYISTHKNQTYGKDRWSKGFVEDVIRKIKSGVYYDQDKYQSYRRHHCCITKENFVQTEINVIRNDIFARNIHKSVIEGITKQSDSIKTIPGFDSSLLDLQIETFNRNQIAIKHCITNIIVQFDVAMPSDTNQPLPVKPYISCIPICLSESHTNIFKSKTTIVNAVLPAELCSILPKTIRKIIDSKFVIPKPTHKTEPQLTTVNELTQCDSGASIKGLISFRINIASSELRIIGYGNYSTKQKAMENLAVKPYISQDSYLNSTNIIDLFLNIKTNILFDCQKNSKAILSIQKSQQLTKPVQNIQLARQISSTCMKIQPYLTSNRQVFSGYRKFNIFAMAAGLLSNQDFCHQLSMSSINPFHGFYNTHHVNINITIKFDDNRVNCIISNIPMNTLYNGLKPNLDSIGKYNNPLNELENCESSVVTVSQTKKRNYVKLFKKTKSMTCVFLERTNTSIRKIRNLGDFFLALGLPKTLTSVFDEATERKIMTSIKEMKNWIDDITPRQALLVLLLSNKKDTSNLMRYRSLILQGVAVNRITRASELNMEIEVIEKENLNTFSLYDGISYVASSIENQDNLFEELYWIAKTTASDYQRPFDETSERLLRSLLQKRKKLNPSYLRVMARYIGLGLLKPLK